MFYQLGKLQMSKKEDKQMEALLRFAQSQHNTEMTQKKILPREKQCNWKLNNLQSVGRRLLLGTVLEPISEAVGW